MKEVLYTIPVNEAFDENVECPVCAMYHSLEDSALDFTLGPSYMEDDVRMVTDRIGFCSDHVDKMYKRGNRLGLALMLKTHADKVLRDVEKLADHYSQPKGSLFKKENTKNNVSEYLDEVSSTCFVCNRINEVFARYIETTFILYENEEEFRDKFKNSKGLCNEHYSLLLKEANVRLSANSFPGFIKAASELYLKNMTRVRDDLSWFIDKFDYRNTDAPWKDSKDALQRMMLKQNSLYYNPDKQ